MSRALCVKPSSHCQSHRPRPEGRGGAVLECRQPDKALINHVAKQRHQAAAALPLLLARPARSAGSMQQSCVFVAETRCTRGPSGRSPWPRPRPMAASGVQGSGDELAERDKKTELHFEAPHSKRLAVARVVWSTELEKLAYPSLGNFTCIAP